MALSSVSLTNLGLRSALSLAVKSICAHIFLPLLFLDARLSMCGRCFAAVFIYVRLCVLFAVAAKVISIQAVVRRAESVLRVLRGVLIDAQDKHHALRDVTLFVHANGVWFVSPCLSLYALTIADWLTEVSDALWIRLCGSVAEVLGCVRTTSQ